MRARYAVGGLIIAAGVAGFLVFLLSRLASFSDEMQRVTDAGELKLERGSHIIYWETEGFRTWPDARVSLQSKSGKAVELSSTWFTTKYSYAGKRGVSLYTFEIEEPGVYVLTAKGVTLAVGPNNVLGLIFTVLGCLVILGGSIACGVWIMVRHRP